MKKMKKKEITIYPYCDQMFALVEEICKCKSEFELNFCCTFSGTGMVGEDLTFETKAGKHVVRIVEESQSELVKADIILIPYSDLSLDNKNEIYEMVVKVLESGKEVICNISFGHEKNRRLLEIKNIKFGEMAYCKNVYDVLGRRLYNNHIPIILTGDLFPLRGEKKNKFGISHNLSEEYKVTEIGGCQFSELINQYDIPSFIYDTSLLEDEKVLKFNDFVRDVIEEKNPDLVIIHLPDAPIRYKRNQNLNGYGILSYIISKAVSAEGIILTIPCNLMDQGIIDKIKEEIKRVYKIPLLGVDISNEFCFVNVDPFLLNLEKESYEKIFKQSLFESRDYKILSSVLDESGLAECVRDYLEEEIYEVI